MAQGYQPRKRSMTPGTSRAHINLWGAGLFIVSYVVLDKLSYIFPVSPLGITPWNPPPGLSMFLLLRFGLGCWPFLLIATIAADLVVRGFPIHWFNSILSGTAITAGYWAAAHVLKNKLHINISLGNARDLWRFLLALVPAAFLISGAYVGIYTLAGAVQAEDYWDHLFKFWIGDLNGLFVLTPALLVHFGSSLNMRGLSRQEVFEVALQAGALGVTLWIIFVVGDQYEFRLFYPLFLPLVWIASRWGLRGATLALVGIQLGLIAAVQIGGYQAASFIQLQSLMLILCVTGLVLGAVVTQRSQVEAELRERQVALSRALRFAAAGEMSSALAHELNQPMAALSAYLGACQKILESSGESQHRLTEILSKAVAESRRASEVVQVLRGFFKSGKISLQWIPPEDILSRAIDGIKSRCDRSAIRVLMDVNGPILPIMADPLQIETALHNLLSNAVDVLELAPSKDRTITVRLQQIPQGVRFQIEDNGPGVSANMKARLFEPFNTSKEDGMGLGLAISKTLVEAHGGTMQCVETGAGAQFRLELPFELKNDTADVT